MLDVLHDSGYAEFAAAEIRTAIAADPRVTGRLSMWARRLVGEALSQAGRVAAERAALTALVGRGDRVDVPGLFGRLTTAHTARMAVVGLNN
ncbi:ferritin-like fold-containing protein [Micromonospora sp. NPDC000663]|uniref:ferritin-like fold-containing protein n=1 Tax=Micromonospora sp. NPDC000663 TaxID=3364218 RepID=UPI0036D0C07B